MPEPDRPLQRLLRRDRLLLILCLVLLCVLAWVHLWNGAGMQEHGVTMQPGMSMPMEMAAPNAAGFLLVLAMWWVMMIAMMLPSATPAILLYERVHAHARASDSERATARTYLFAAGYLLCWLAFSLVAALVHGWLAGSGQISADLLAFTNPWVSGAILLAVGLYQLSPLKTVCLAHCRSPAGFFANHWRPGQMGAILLGIRHGLFCLGCCWVLMLLLFVAGVMNLLWIVLLSLFVLAEKLIPYGPVVARVSGILLVVLGLTSLVREAAVWPF